MNTEDLEFTDMESLRRKAEELLKEQKRASDAYQDADAKKLLHELQVHQIELEMQNDELRNAYDTAESALKKYTMLYDLAPLGFFVLESNGTISELNFTAAEMLGEKRFSLEKVNFKLFVSEDSIPAFNQFLREVFASFSKQSCELMLRGHNNSLFRVYLEGIVSDEDQECLVSVLDISRFSQ